MPLARDLAARLPGSKLRQAGATATLVFEVDGAWLDARIREAPRIEVFIRTIDVGDLHLELRPSGARIDLPVKPQKVRTSAGVHYEFLEADVQRAIHAAAGQIRFETHVEVEHDDFELAALWLDEPVREAARDAIWLAPDVGVLSVKADPAGYRILLERAEVLVTRSSELEVDRLLRAVRAGAVLASRPHRIGRAWLDVARGLGGTTTADRWDLGREFAAVFDRGAAEVRIDNVRERRLVTRVRARRVGGDGATWRWDGRDELPERLRPLRTLLAAAAPARAAAARDEITLAFDGLFLDPARLGPAIEVVGRLAVDLAAPTGPYR